MRVTLILVFHRVEAVDTFPFLFISSMWALVREVIPSTIRTSGFGFLTLALVVPMDLALATALVRIDRIDDASRETIT